MLDKSERLSIQSATAMLREFGDFLLTGRNQTGRMTRGGAQMLNISASTLLPRP